jgi:2-aminoadipate transaminase
MLDALETTFDATSTWTRPSGGFFLWLDLPAPAAKVVPAAQAAGVAVMSGELFYANLDGGQNAIRLSFSNADPARIREGIERLRRAVAAVAP